MPDTATVVADYDEGCQVIISATMCNDTQLGEMIRGRLATLKFTGGGDYMKDASIDGLCQPCQQQAEFELRQSRVGAPHGGEARR